MFLMVFYAAVMPQHPLYITVSDAGEKLTTETKRTLQLAALCARMVKLLPRKP